MAKSAEEPTTYALGSHGLAEYTKRAPSKLHPQWRGPFVVEGVNGQQYTCVDVFTGKTHNFHVSRFKAFVCREGVSVEELAMQDHDMHIVEAIVGHQGAERKGLKNLEFKLRWSGYEEADDSWVPWRDCRKLELLPAYLQSVPELNKFKRFLPRVEVHLVAAVEEQSVAAVDAQEE